MPLISPGDANPTPWGAGIQVPGRFRDMFSVRPFFLPTEEPLLHKRIHCTPAAEVQWSSRTAETNRGPSPAHVRLLKAERLLRVPRGYSAGCLLQK